MKVFVLGKLGSIVHWTEDSIAGFREAGHEVRLGVTRNPRLSPAIERVLTARWAGVPRAAAIARAIRRFEPGLILAIVPHGIPLAILQQVAAIPSRAPLIGWVGDMFAASDRRIADLFDALAYTDTGLLELHWQFGFRSTAVFLPHAASPRQPAAQSTPRRDRMVFVANPTPHRRAVTQAIRSPMRLYGPGWSSKAPTAHEIEDRRVGAIELAGIYRSHIAALNIHHERNVLLGLNQRHFDPCLAATPVVTDNQPDLPLCFEPGREALVYRDSEELNAIYARLQREPGYAASIGAAAQRRVLADHVYSRRLAALAALG